VAATFPLSPRAFVAQVDLVSTVIADNVNSLQQEVAAIEATFGTAATNQNPLVSTWSGSFTTSLVWGTVADRLNNIEYGLVNGVTNAPYVLTTGGSTVTTSSNKGLVLKTGSGTSNLLETYSSSSALGFNLDSSGNPNVGANPVLYVNSGAYNTLVAATTTVSNSDALKLPLAAFTAVGDLLIGTGSSTYSHLSIGTAGQALVSNGTTATWTTPTDTTKIPLSTVTTAGDLILGTGSASVSRLGIGTSGQVLTSNGTTASWQTPTTYLATSNASVSAASTSLGVVRNTWISTTAPTSGQGNTGDIWIVYS
jgi:hypothetical protein